MARRRSRRARNSAILVWLCVIAVGSCAQPAPAHHLRSAAVAPADDVDADGIHALDDNCDGAANPDQANQDGDASGDACDWDDDGDFVSDADDICPLVVNPDQQPC